MDLTTIFVISGVAIAIYITFLVLGFSLKGKNIKAQNLKDKNQIYFLIKRYNFTYYNEISDIDRINIFITLTVRFK